MSSACAGAALREPNCTGCGRPIARCSAARAYSPKGSTKVAIEFADDPLVQKVIAFIRASGKRPLMHPAAARAAGDSEADGL